MPQLSEQASSVSMGSPPGVGPGSATRAEGPWTASVRGFLAVVLAVVGTALMVAGRPDRPGRGDLGRVVPELVLDLNEAPPGVLSALPGVGESLAHRIVAERRARRFASPADLRWRTSGVGPATLARLAPHLRVEADRLARAE